MSPKGKPGRIDHKQWLDDPKVKTWYEGAELRSPLTAAVNLRQMGHFLHHMGLTPKSLAELAAKKPADLNAKLVEYANLLQKKGRLASYIAKTFVGIKSWLLFNDVEFHKFPKLKVIRGESLREERVPTQEELRRMLSLLNPRAKVAALMMAHAGVRPGVLARVDGTGGLRLRDLPELKWEEKGWRFERVPFLVRVPGQLSKNSREYVTFGSGELAEAVLAYLQHRSHIGEVLGPDSPLVASSPAAHKRGFRYTERQTRGGFLTTKNLMEEIRDGVKAVLSARTYVLRAFCSTQLWMAGNHGKIDRDGREALLGHDLGVAGRYNLSKKLHPSMIEELRSAYARCEPFLSTIPTKDESQSVANSTRMLLTAIGYDEKEVAGIDVENLDAASLQDLFQKKLSERLPDPTPTANPSPSAPSATAPKVEKRVVKVREVAKYVADGWEPVMKLDATQVYMTRPA
jgi:hypothetical protein